MKIKSEYSYPCFSGECGFCPICCRSENINNNEKESIQRAKVLKKFINQQRLEDEQTTKEGMERKARKPEGEL